MSGIAAAFILPIAGIMSISLLISEPVYCALKYSLADREPAPATIVLDPAAQKPIAPPTPAHCQTLQQIPAQTAITRPEPVVRPGGFRLIGKDCCSEKGDREQREEREQIFHSLVSRRPTRRRACDARALRNNNVPASESHRRYPTC